MKLYFLNTNCKGLCIGVLCWGTCIMSFPITGLFISTLCKSCPNIKFLSMMNNEAAPSYFNGGTYQQYADYRYKVLLAWMVCGWPARPILSVWEKHFFWPPHFYPPLVLIVDWSYFNPFQEIILHYVYMYMHEYIFINFILVQ